MESETNAADASVDRVVITPLQVAAMIDNTISEKAIARICEAVAEVNFKIDDQLHCKVERHEDDESCDWEYSLRFKLTHFADEAVAEQLVSFFREVNAVGGLFALRWITVDLMRFKICDLRS
jgi:hypothetical protein